MSAQPVVLSLEVDQVVGDAEQRPLRPGARLQRGDSIVLHAGVDSAAYLYVLQRSADGTVARVFPRGDDDGFDARARSVDMPPPGASFQLTGRGEEVFYVVASLRPIAQADPRIAGLLEQARGGTARVLPGEELPTRGDNPPPPPPPPDKVPEPKGPGERGIALASVGARLRVRTDEGGVAVVKFWLVLPP